MSGKQSTGEKDSYRVVELLMKAAETDTAFRDLFLQRAALQLGGLMPEQEYRSLCADQARIDVILRQVRAEVQGQNWARVKALSQQVEHLRQLTQQKGEALALAAAVYDADEVRVDPFSAGLAGFALPPGQTVASLRSALVATFAELGKKDVPWAALYAERQRYFEQKVLPTDEPSSEGQAAPKADLTELRQQAREAAERGDAARLQRLADEITQASEAAKAAPAVPAERRTEATGVAPQSISTEPFPAGCLERAAQLGLEHLCTKARFAEMPAVLADFLARHAWQPSIPAADQAKEGAASLRTRLEGLDIPADAKGPMVEMAAMMALHPLINSGGVRYLGAEPGEYVLLETFPEDAEPPAQSEILSLLGLGSRRKLSRVAIEEALRHRGSALLQERLGLEPREFRMVCVPFDVYYRIGSERGWGAQEQWTHVDGYAVQRGGRLGALAAGNARYGGLNDLVILPRTDERENVVARFCVVRRARLLSGGG